MVSVAIGIVVIDGRVAGGSVGMVLVAHLLTKRIFFIALVWRSAVSVAQGEVEYILLDFFDNFLQFWWFVLNDELVLFDLGDEMGIFLKLLCEFDCLFDILKPFLCCLLVFTCVKFFVWQLDYEVA